MISDACGLTIRLPLDYRPLAAPARRTRWRAMARAVGVSRARIREVARRIRPYRLWYSRSMECVVCEAMPWDCECDDFDRAREV